MDEATYYYCQTIEQGGDEVIGIFSKRDSTKPPIIANKRGRTTLSAGTTSQSMDFDGKFMNLAIFVVTKLLDH